MNKVLRECEGKEGKEERGVLRMVGLRRENDGRDRLRELSLTGERRSVKGRGLLSLLMLGA